MRLAAALLLALPAALGAQAGAPDSIVIRHATVIDVASGQRVRDRDVTVADGRIASVTKARSGDAASGATVVDGRGKFLIPGLWDMHSHAAAEELPLMIAAGVTGTRIMDGRHGEPLQWRAEALRGERVAPRIVTAGPVLEGPPPAGLASVIETEGTTVLTSPDSAAAEVRREKAAGFDFVKVYNNLSRPVYDAIVAEARRERMPVAGHVPFAVGIRGVLAARQLSVEHLRGYVEALVPRDAPQQPGADLRSRDLAWRFADPARMREIVQATIDAGTWNTPTLVWTTYDLPAEERLRFLQRPESLYMPASERDTYRDPRRMVFYSNFSDEDFRLAAEGIRRQEALVRALRDAGAGILAGTDVPPAGFALHWELERLVGAGLTPLEALRAATISPARFLHATDSLGTIERGKVADLVLLDADPLDDIGNVARVRAVVAAGRLFDRAALDALLAEVRRAIH
jgi:imidazolonepropionase-like amidohydrolase